MNITPPVKNKIQKYIDTHELLVQQDTIYILCTDSKGRYLKPLYLIHIKTVSYGGTKGVEKQKME